MNLKNILIYATLLLAFSLVLFVSAADKDKNLQPVLKEIRSPNDPIVEDNWKFHKIGTLWSRVTNFGKTGDDAYRDRTPSGDWPGGSGNSYLYRGSLWLTAKIDGVVHVTMPETPSEYAPLDSVHLITGAAAVSEEDTYTRYYDVKAPGASSHVPLGIEVTERTYAWSESYRDDFIIYEFTIKNVGIDTDDDGYPDTPRDLQEFYFTYRLDGDITKPSDAPSAEGPLIHIDDFACCNASWDFIDLFPEWAGVEHGLTSEQADSMMTFMWDGDNPNYNADNGQADDTGNPGPDGTLQSPGFLGFKILKVDPPSFKVSSFHTNHIDNDPDTDQEAYDRFMKESVAYFEGVVVHPATGKPFPHDYRAIITIGPMDNFQAGDSIVVTAALGVGCDPEKGGIYSLIELVKIMDIAQMIVDLDYQLVIEPPPTPEVEVKEYVENGVVKGVKVSWDNTGVTHPSFQGFKVWKSSGKTASGAFEWEPLGKGTYIDTTNSPNWPPPTGDEPNQYQIIDPNVINGFDYYYSVQAFSIEFPEPFAVMETNILSSLKYISPTNPVATDLSRVKVVPNPYIGSVAWNNPIPGSSDPWEHRLQFTNLPADATIKIFTLDGDFVKEIKSGEIVRKSGAFAGAISLSIAEWDLITRNNQEAAPGIYLYVVESPTAGTKIDKFVIIR